MTKQNASFRAVLISVFTAAISLSLLPILVGEVQNPPSYPVGIVGLFFSCLILSGLFSIGVSWAAVLCGARCARWTIVAAVSVAAIAWIKNSFMQWDYGPLDGTSPDWDLHPFAGKLDVGLILAITLAAVWLRDSLLRHFRQVCAFLFLAQILFLIWVSPVFSKASFADLFAKETVLARAKNSELLSTTNNLILIVLDTFPSDVFGEIVRKREALKTEFPGFTFFADATSTYPYTLLSVPSVLTGQDYLNQSPYPHYLYESYRNPLSLFPKLKQAGFYVELEKWGSATPIPHIADLGSNLERKYLPRLETLGTLQLLTLYRIAPQFIKKLWFERTHETIMSLGGLRDNNLSFIRQNLSLPIEKTAQPVAKFIHLKGPHLPLNKYKGLGFDYFSAARDRHPVAENAPISRENFVSVAGQSIKAVSAYLERLRAAGVYDRSTIIVFGDHGAGLQGQEFVSPPDTQASLAEPISLPIQAAALPLLLVKPSGGSGPLQTSLRSASLKDINCSIHGMLDEKEVVGCRSLFKPTEPMEREERVYYALGSKLDRDFFYPVMQQFSITAPAWLSDSWSDTGRRFFRENALQIPPYEFGGSIKFGRGGNSQTFESLGWDSPSEGFSWTVGPQSILTIPLRDAPTIPIVLEATFSPFVVAGKLDRQRVRVYVDGERITEWIASEGGRYRAVIPRRLTLDRSIKVNFRLPDAISPLRLGIGDDASALGIQMQSVVLRELTVPGNSLSFGRGGNSEPYQIGGWGDPGAGFTWTVGSRATLDIPLREGSRGSTMLEASLIPMLVPGKLEHQRIKVFANEELIAEWTANAAGSYRAVVPPHLEVDRLLKIRFDLPDAASPFALGLGPDRTALGIQMRSLVVSELADPKDGRLSFGIDGNARPNQIEGWDNANQGFSWTIGKQASLAVPVPPSSGMLVLQASFDPWIVPGKLDHQQVDVYANQEKIASWTAVAGGDFRAVIPARLLGQGLIHLRFDLPDASTSATLGLGDSREEFGLRMQSISFRRADYRVGDIIGFGRDGNAAPYLIEGWNNPSDGFTWTVGKRSRIALAAKPAAHRPLELEATILPFVVPGKLPLQRVAVLVNGERIADLSVAEAGTYRAEIPAHLLTEEVVDIRFDLPDAASPASLGLNDDAAVFALQVVSLALRENL